MTPALCFWIVMLIWFVLGLWEAKGQWRERAPSALLFVLLFLLGWNVFGWPIQA